ncbi:MAG TPA: helix-turn-helix transcriptional regulator [Longimicrobiales bacterium]|nr:helix-turn-helix transcriptional regulator [Longimicrobiales bacterium]
MPLDDLLPLSPLSMAILLALADGAQHGYALMQQIEAQTDGALKPGTGSLYAGLQRLLGDGLIAEVEGEPGADRRRRTFDITSLGRELAEAEAHRMLRVLDVASEKKIIGGLNAARS